jgi:hypothetical protein
MKYLIATEGFGEGWIARAYHDTRPDMFPSLGSGDNGWTYNEPYKTFSTQKEAKAWAQQHQESLPSGSNEASAAKQAQRVSLTKAQIASAIGQDFLCLLIDIGKDGILEYEELERLSDWLNRNKDTAIPAVSFLFNLMVEVCADQNLTLEELVEIQLGIERVLPPQTRSQIKNNRLALIPPKEADSEPDPATQRQLDYIRALGGNPPVGLSKWDASDMIDQLLEKPMASSRQIMFLRFWDRLDLANRSRDEVSAWMSQFIDGDERRKHAWNTYKAEIGDDGSQRDPSFVPIGIGFQFLDRCRMQAVSPQSGYRRWFGA